MNAKIGGPLLHIELFLSVGILLNLKLTNLYTLCKSNIKRLSTGNLTPHSSCSGQHFWQTTKLDSHNYHHIIYNLKSLRNSHIDLKVQRSVT
ncbi:hypothetical protein DASB73_016200 [Starmerella bacillaris]|uniref:Uncharacterized protein n=1 Tax=Starmerella bacillaris TaxID=1247836 RepID=A0AAV5RI30_STABA|nr:hypothetical protein DASB73_016200 [Starmerella bacillaris]